MGSLYRNSTYSLPSICNISSIDIRNDNANNNNNSIDDNESNASSAQQSLLLSLPSGANFTESRRNDTLNSAFEELNQTCPSLSIQLDFERSEIEIENTPEPKFAIESLEGVSLLKTDQDNAKTPTEYKSR